MTPAASAPAAQVGVGTHDFRVACLGALPHLARLQLLSDAKTLRDVPGWVRAAVQVGVFEITNGGYSTHRERLAVGEHQAIAMVVTALLSRSEEAPSDRLIQDPTNGDLLSADMGEVRGPVWAPPIRRAFVALVDHVIGQFPKAAVAMAVAGGAPKKAETKKSQLPVVPSDRITVNLAILLTAACATGDVQTADRIARACPGAMVVPVSQSWMGEMEFRQMLTPPMVAAAFNQVGVLDALKDRGWDPMGPLMLVQSSSKLLRDMMDTKAKGRSVFDVLTMADNAVDVADRMWPRTAEFFLREASLRYASTGASDAPPPLSSEQGKRFISVAREAVAGREHKEWLGALDRSGLFERHADDLVHAAVERVNASRRRQADIATGSTSASQIRYLNRFLDHIDWSLHRGTGFLVDRALERGNGDTSLALYLVKKCVQAGHVEMITQHHMVHGQGEDFSPVHKWSAQGHTELVAFAIEQGADPLGLWIGVTPIAAAEANGHADTANAIRSIVARRTAQAAIDSMDMDRADSLSFPRPAGRRAP